MTDDEARAKMIRDEIAKLVGLPLVDAEAQARDLAQRLIAETFGASLVEIETVDAGGDTLRFVTKVDARWCVDRTAAELRAMGMDVAEAIPGDAVMVIVDGEIGWLRTDVTAL
jgi:hypothetical protein